MVRLFGGDPNAQRESISEEELRDIVAGHEQLGREERQLIEDVFEAGERQLHEVMVPRTEVDFLDASTPVFKALRNVSTRPHSRYPVIRGTPDDVIGFIHVRDLFAPEISGQSVRVGEIARPVKQMPGTKRVLSALSELRREGHHLAIVVDEYGGTDGIVTMEDLMEEVIGEIYDEYDVEEQQTRSLRGGDIEVDGLLSVEDFDDKTGLELPDGPYETVAGFVIHQLGRLPAVDESIEALGHRFTVTELDGRRVAKVRLSALPATEPAAETAPPRADQNAAGRAGPVRTRPPCVVRDGSELAGDLDLSRATVEPQGAVGKVVADSTAQEVVAGGSQHRVVAPEPPDAVVPEVAVEHVRPRVADDLVVEPRADHPLDGAQGENVRALTERRPGREVDVDRRR